MLASRSPRACCGWPRSRCLPFLHIALHDDAAPHVHAADGAIIHGLVRRSRTATRTARSTATTPRPRETITARRVAGALAHGDGTLAHHGAAVAPVAVPLHASAPDRSPPDRARSARSRRPRRRRPRPSPPRAGRPRPRRPCRELAPARAVAPSRSPPFARTMSIFKIAGAFAGVALTFSSALAQPTPPEPPPPVELPPPAPEAAPPVVVTPAAPPPVVEAPRLSDDDLARLAEQEATSKETIEIIDTAPAESASSVHLDQRRAAVPLAHPGLRHPAPGARPDGLRSTPAAENRTSTSSAASTPITAPTSRSTPTASRSTCRATATARATPTRTS